MMRSVLAPVATLTMILAAGSLRAENAKLASKPTCPILGATVMLTNVFKDGGGYAMSKPPETTAYDGQTFTVTRATQISRVIHRDGTPVRNPKTDPDTDRRDVGYDAIRLKGKSGTFVIRNDHIWGSPALQTGSQLTGKGIRWGRADHGRWMVEPDSEGDFNPISDGPLNGYKITLTACPRRAAVRALPVKNTPAERILDEAEVVRVPALEPRPRNPAPPVFTWTRPSSSSEPSGAASP